MGRVLTSGTYPLADALRAPFLNAVSARLSTYVALLVLLEGNSVHTGADPADKPASGKWLTVAFEKPMGGTPEDGNGWLRPRLWIKSECRMTRYAFSAALDWHSQVHAAVATRILGYKATLTGGTNGGTGQVYQREDSSADIQADLDDQTYYFASYFSTVIIPAQAA
jgi:hypothetical protein